MKQGRSDSCVASVRQWEELEHGPPTAFQSARTSCASNSLGHLTDHLPVARATGGLMLVRSLLGRFLPRFLFVAATALAVPSPCRSEIEGGIVVSALSFGQSCTVLDSPGLHSIYILHRNTPGAIGSRFKVSTGNGVTWTYVSETVNAPMFVGNTQRGIALCYGDCIAETTLLATISYMGYGTGLSCGQINIVPHPQAQTVEAAMCDGTPVSLVVNDLYVVRVLGDCGCPSGHVFVGSPQVFNCQPVAAAQTTWGAIKALYRN